MEVFRGWPADAKGITFEPCKWRILIHKSTIEALGTPEYVRFLFNAEKRRFAVQACGMHDDGAEKLPKLQTGDGGYVYCMFLVQYVFKTCEWNPEYTHRAAGILYSRERLVDFDLNHFWELRWEEVTGVEQGRNDDPD